MTTGNFITDEVLGTRREREIEGHAEKGNDRMDTRTRDENWKEREIESERERESNRSEESTIEKDVRMSVGESNRSGSHVKRETERGWEKEQEVRESQRERERDGERARGPAVSERERERERGRKSKRSGSLADTQRGKEVR